MDVARCTAPNEDGSDCTRDAEPHSVYCRLHRDDFGQFRGWAWPTFAKREHGADVDLIARLFARSPAGFDVDAPDPVSRERMDGVDLSSLVPRNSRLSPHGKGIVYQHNPAALFRLRLRSDQFGLAELAKPSSVTKLGLANGRAAWSRIQIWKIGSSSLLAEETVDHGQIDTGSSELVAARALPLRAYRKSRGVEAFVAEKDYAGHFRWLAGQGERLSPPAEGLSLRADVFEALWSLASFFVDFEEGRALLISLQAGGPLKFDDKRNAYVPIESRTRDLQKRVLSSAPRLWVHFKVAIAATYLHLAPLMESGGATRKWREPHPLADGRRGVRGVPPYKSNALELTAHICREMEATWLGDLTPRHVKNALDWALSPSR